MNKQRISAFLLFGSLYSSVLFSAHEIAITIDDLPFVGSSNGDQGKLKREHDRFLKILQALKDNKVPATGFVIANSIEPGQWALLEQFKNEGFIIGNHTYSHANLNRLPAEKYIQEIAHADEILAPLMTQQKYFRYPYLAEASGEKKEQVHQYLASTQYQIAPVTIDSKDYRFNAQLLGIPWRVRSQHLAQIKRQYLNYIWNQTLRAEKRSHHADDKQILLIHANLLNSYFLGDIIEMYKQHGYQFISLSDALKHAAPTLNTLESTETNQNAQPDVQKNPPPLPSLQSFNQIEEGPHTWLLTSADYW